MLKKIFFILCTLLLSVSLVLTSTAFEEPDLNRKGSVSIALKYEGQPVKGGSVTLYRVAEVVLNRDADYSYGFVTEFSGCTASLADISASGLAKAIADYVSANNISGVKTDINDNGEASFTDLELGLYLMVQETPAEGFEAIAPFLVSVPVKQNESLAYDVDATPKLNIEKTPESPPPPDLPQTGQLKWPIPILAVGGIALVAVGWFLRSSSERKKSKNEI